jgi:pyruvate/2-oxoglutarate/acetoin dehydrogenase E1 component
MNQRTRPVAEIQFADYIYPGFDQVVSELARLRYRSAGDFSAPVTIRTPRRRHSAARRISQSPEALFAHVCGIKVVMPSNPYDAKGLLISSIEGDDPVVFFEPKRIYNGPFDGEAAQAGDAVERTRAGKCRKTLPCPSAVPRSYAREVRRRYSPTAPWCTWPRRP